MLTESGKGSSINNSSSNNSEGTKHTQEDLETEQGDNKNNL